MEDMLSIKDVLIGIAGLVFIAIMAMWFEVKALERDRESAEDKKDDMGSNDRELSHYLSGLY